MLTRISLIAAATVLVMAPGHAETSGDFTVSLSIPEVCQIESSSLTIDASGQSASGSVFEICNSGRSFQIVASHRPLVSGEEVEIIYDGEVRQLDSSGISDVAYRYGPVASPIPVEIRTNGLIESFSISLGVAVL